MTDTAEVTVEFINPNQLPDLWPKIQPFLVEAVQWSAGQFDLKGVVNGLLEGDYTLICIREDGEPQSALVVTVSQFPTGKRTLEVLLAAGLSAKTWVAHEHKLDEFAKLFGCADIRMIGREGLQRILTEWKRSAVVLSREVR